jgi:hypothetical protein
MNYWFIGDELVGVKSFEPGDRLIAFLDDYKTI